MGNLEESTTIDSQTATTCSESSQTCISIQNLITTTDGNYETTGDVSLDVNWNIPTLKTLTVKEGDKFIIASTLTVIGKIIVEGTLDNLSKNLLNITGSGVVIVETGATLNNGNDVNLFGSIVNTGSLVVYGTMNNNLGSLLNNISGEVSYSGTIKNNGFISKENDSYGTFYESVLGISTFVRKPEDLKPTDGLFGTLTNARLINSISVPKNTELINSAILVINNNSVINNYGTITNNNKINIARFGKIANNSIINNNSVINNYGVIDNYQNISNNDTINNIIIGKINNIEPNGTINPRGTINGNQPKEEVPPVKGINVRSRQSIVAVDVWGYKGQKLSVKISRTWVVVPALASNSESVYRIFKSGRVVHVNIFIDDVLVKSLYITVRD